MASELNKLAMHDKKIQVIPGLLSMFRPGRQEFYKLIFCFRRHQLPCFYKLIL